ncbi:MAG TPA: hypothetical protein PLS68_07155 [Actinotalea sp.]|nr:hypothetical protein [Actinotalea sp.]
MALPRKAVVAAAVPVGFLLSGVLVWQASYAAFSDTTDSTGNTWEAGSVSLTDNDTGTALFTVSGLTPGETGSRCIVVHYGGDVFANVKTYGAFHDTDANGTPDAVGLAPYLNLTVTLGTGAQPDCTDFSPGGATFTGTADAFVTAHHDFATGGLTWMTAAAAPEDATYRITYQLADDDAAQGQDLTLDVIWEAQSL